MAVCFNLFPYYSNSLYHFHITSTLHVTHLFAFSNSLFLLSPFISFFFPLFIDLISRALCAVYLSSLHTLSSTITTTTPNFSHPLTAPL